MCYSENGSGAYNLRIMGMQCWLMSLGFLLGLAMACGKIVFMLTETILAFALHQLKTNNIFYAVTLKKYIQKGCLLLFQR